MSRGSCQWVTLKDGRTVCGMCGNLRDVRGDRPCPTQKTAAPNGGPGTELKNWLAGLGLPSCQQCSLLAAEMNWNGPQWCRDNLDYLTDRIEENRAALAAIQRQNWVGRVFDTMPARIRKKAIKTCVMRYGIQAYEREVQRSGAESRN